MRINKLLDIFILIALACSVTTALVKYLYFQDFVFFFKINE